MSVESINPATAGDQRRVLAAVLHYLNGDQDGVDQVLAEAQCSGRSLEFIGGLLGRIVDAWNLRDDADRVAMVRTAIAEFAAVEEAGR